MIVMLNLKHYLYIWQFLCMSVCLSAHNSGTDRVRVAPGHIGDGFKHTNGWSCVEGQKI